MEQSSNNNNTIAIDFNIIDTDALDAQHNNTINKYKDIVVKYKDVKSQIKEKLATLESTSN